MHHYLFHVITITNPITEMGWCFRVISLLLLLLGAESKTHWSDTEFLKDFKNGIHPSSVNPGSCLSSWDFTLDPCDNLFTQKFTCGFRCDSIDSGLSRVTELALDQAGYSGPLPPTWNLLPYLQTLDLSNNFFYGNIPGSLSNLTRLRRLALSANSFSGAIPSSIGSLSTLEELCLDHNNLTGAIPATFNGLKNLKRLELQSNKLQGWVPPYLGPLNNLNYLDASDNSLIGELPIWLPASLVQISMRNNKLSGVLKPEVLKNLKDLQVLDLSWNKLSGAVPFALFELPSLQQLTLSFNEFSSVEENSAGFEKSGLIAVDISNNKLRGSLPWFMAWMAQLSALSLENNMLSGKIPREYAMKVVSPRNGESSFGRLLLGGNYLYGGIPHPLLRLKPDSANVTLANNCFYRCPRTFFFCQGAAQKPPPLCHK
ncbi:hypothetical protein HN51_068687 [Arachis hypogaea]|uniref:LRR receptor-like serine/threonine-protein kinase FLS2 n=1 Tax=Arachis ipaensis TaxID=130454 RepID=UPI0007AF64D8|nr:LRR receptor-like serine/threonine-protein kinase FLS2 [Arachis ipaensis]XP_025653545.1 LRR receptor-like serine/threonine-protein kinase FLS2 [Arachis hypogaea]